MQNASSALPENAVAFASYGHGEKEMYRVNFYSTAQTRMTPTVNDKFRITKERLVGFWQTLIFALGTFLLSGVAFGQVDVTRSLFTPPVVPETQTDPVRFEVTIIGTSSPVVFEYDFADRPMFDDGTHGDQVPGDNTWTVMFTPAEILSKNTPSRVFRPFIGFVKVDSLRLNVFAEVWTSAIGLRNIRSLDSSGQETNYIVNYGATLAELMNFNQRAWAQRFYQAHGDNFDFLNFVLLPGRRGNRFHTNIRNTVQGIGLPNIDFGADYGSAGRLKGINQYPISSFYDGGEKVFLHETGHQWINFLSNTSFASGRPHWPKGNIAGNVVGFSIPGSGAGGDYPYTFSPNGSGGYLVGSSDTLVLSTFNSMELYLMGLVPPEEVGNFFVLADQALNVTPGQVLQPSEVTPVSIAQIIGVHGSRIPDTTQSQKSFRVATILISEQLLDAHAMAFYDYFARRTEAKVILPFASGFSTGMCNPWYLATGGRSLMRSALSGAAPFDFDGDGRSDISVFRPADATWYVSATGDGVSTEQFGLSSDTIVPADFDGDGKTDIAVFRDGIWYWLNRSNNQFNVYQFGQAGDISVPADYTGDGRAELAVYRNGQWWSLDLSNGHASVLSFGLPADKPVVADYDGDGKSDQSIYRNGEWHLNLSTTGYRVISFGLPTDQPLTGDFDGDGKADPAVYRDGAWYVLQSSEGVKQFQFGLGSDIPVPADYDGDGKTDFTIFRNGQWWTVRSSSGGITVTSFGLSDDRPVPSAFLR